MALIPARATRMKNTGDVMQKPVSSQSRKFTNTCRMCGDASHGLAAFGSHYAVILRIMVRLEWIARLRLRPGDNRHESRLHAHFEQVPAYYGVRFVERCIAAVIAT